MKTTDFIFDIPNTITPDILIALAAELESRSGYEKFEPTSDYDGACICGVREETAEELENRQNMEEKERQEHQRWKREERRRIDAVLAKNPGVIYNGQPRQLQYTGFAEKMLETPELRKSMALAMNEPLGYFTKDDQDISWGSLNHD